MHKNEKLRGFGLVNLKDLPFFAMMFFLGGFSTLDASAAGSPTSAYSFTLEQDSFSEISGRLLPGMQSNPYGVEKSARRNETAELGQSGHTDHTDHSDHINEEAEGIVEGDATSKGVQSDARDSGLEPAKDSVFLRPKNAPFAMEVVGLQRTTPDTTVKIMNRNQESDDWSLELAVKNLRNSGIFSAVDVVSNPDEKGLKKAARLVVKERWTTIPIVKFSSGGGVTKSTFGLYDINWFGRFLEIGAQVEILEGQPSFVVWNRTPFVLGSDVKLKLELWDTNELMRMYTDGFAKDPSFYLTNEKIFRAGLEKSFSKSFEISLDYEYTNFENSVSEIDIEDQYEDFESTVFNSYQSHRLSLGIHFGGMDYNSYLEDGSLASIRVGIEKFSNFELDPARTTLDTPEKIDSARDLSLSYKWAKTFLADATAAVAVKSFSTSENNLIVNKRVGGLEHVRGFPHSAFIGNKFSWANLEVRKPVYSSELLVLQPVLFVDGLSEEDTYTSYGSGVRFIVPKVYRLTARFDFAVTSEDEIEPSFNFGLQQFF